MSTPPLVFGGRPLVIGVVHLRPLPGAPRFNGDLAGVLGRAVEDAGALASGGCDALLVENFGDAPFFAEHVPPETIAAMALALDAVRGCVPNRALGVNVLRNDARAALGLCAAAGATFLRINVHTGAALTDQGVIQGRAAETLRERERLAPGAAILADVHVKHAVPLAPEDPVQAARDTRGRGLADALVISGRATGSPPSLERLAAVREAVPDAPVLIGSGTDPEQAARLMEFADGAIIGTWFKRHGAVERPVDPARVRALCDVVHGLG